MPSEQQLGVKFIGYSAFLVTPSMSGEDKILATLDFVTDYLFVPVPEEQGLLMVDEIGQLKPFLQKLQAAAPELDAILKSLTMEQQVEVGAFRLRKDVTTGQTSISASRNELLLLENHNLGAVLEELMRRTADWDKVLKQIQRVGRQFKRLPYDEHIAGVREGAVTVQVHGFGIFRSGHLTMLPPPLMGVA
jgi:hypothetical protein